MPEVTDPALLKRLNGKQAAPQQQAQGPQPMTIGMPDPKAPLETVKVKQDVARGAATLPYEGPKAAADARKAEADATIANLKAEAAAKEQAAAPDPMSAKIQQQLQTDSVLGMLNTARAQIGKGWSTGNIFGSKTFQGIPVAGQNSTDLDATLTGVSGNIIKDVLAQLKAASATGASGFGSLTEREGQLLQSSVAALQQKQSEESLLRNLAAVELHYRNALALLNKEDPRETTVAQKYGILKADGSSGIPGISGQDSEMSGHGGAGDPTMPSGGNLTSEGRFESVAGLHGANASVLGMVKDGKSAQEIRSYLNRLYPGLGDNVRGVEDAVEFYRQNPGIDPKVDIEKIWVPNNSVSQALGDIGMSAPGAAVVGAADMLSMGALDNFTENPELARAVMTGAQQENPKSYLLGQIGGGVLTGLGAELGLAKVGMEGANAFRVGDFLNGAVYSFGSADEVGDDRVTAALLGGASGVTGGMAGRGMSRIAGRTIAGLQDPVLQALDDAGIRMTPGQILGGNIKRTEDRISGLPLVGDQIAARRSEGIGDLNVAAFDQGLAPSGRTTGGVTGAPGIDMARQIRSDMYSDALDPVTVTADTPFVADMGGVINAGRALPEPMRSNIEYTLPTRVGQAFDASGNLSGRDYQQALRGLRRDANAVENQPYGYDFAQVTRQAEDALGSLLERQSPGTEEALRLANEVNRNVETLRDAVNRARNGSRSGDVETFMPSQLADAAAASAKKYGNSHGTTNQPFYDLTRAAQQVLPSSIPDSGSAGRWMIPALVGAGVSGGSYAMEENGDGNAPSSAINGLVAAALASAPYSRGVQRTIQRVLLGNHPDWMIGIGNQLVSKDAIAGLLARPYANILLTE